MLNSGWVCNRCSVYVLHGNIHKCSNGFYPEISFIVSSYNRPELLNVCLASLSVQSRSHEIMVCDNWTGDESMNRKINKVCSRYGIKPIPTGQMGAKCCYESAEIAIKKAKGKWLCFPSDDDYYVPTFSEVMIYTATVNQLDLCYCDMLWHPEQLTRWAVVNTIPKIGMIDKGAFILKKEKFRPFPDKRPVPTSGDGQLIEILVRSGIRHGNTNAVLMVHN